MPKRAATRRKQATYRSSKSGSQRPRQSNAVVVFESGSQLLRDAAYEAIKHRIITCQFKPGEYINEAYVSAMLDIGRTPVHQAIDRLMLEGMVSVLPRKGVIVKAVSFDEVMQIVEVRLLNETFCARLAADRATPDETKKLTEVLKRGRQWVAAGDIEQLMLIDKEFHSVLARASKSAVLGDILLKLHERSLRFWFLSLNRPGHHESVQRQHEDILAAIKSRDTKGAEQAIKAHIDAFRDNLVGIER